MVKKRNLYFLFVVFWNMPLYGQPSWGSIGSQWSHGAQSVVNTTESIGEGIVGMFGVVPPGYSFSFIVYNGLQTSVQVKTRSYKEVMGGRFKGDIIASTSIAPGSNSGGTFTSTPLYFRLEIPTCNFDEGHYTLGMKNDSTVYVYHTFNDPDSLQPKAERLGVVSATSTDFSGLIYNGSGRTAFIQFPWNGQKVLVPVEAGTFSALSSTSENQLRPSTLVLNNQNIAIAAVGLGTQVTSGSTGSSSVVTTQPTRYNYQMTPSGAVETGLFPGNYKQPVSQIRDITPMNVQIWNQPVNTENTIANLAPINSPQYSLWFVYTGQAINHQDGTLVNNPIVRIPYGKCVSLTLLRPSISQQLAKLFIVQIKTTQNNNAAINTFLTRLANTNLPPLVVPVPSKKFIELSEKTLLTEKLPDDVGFLNNGAGIQGVIVQTDIFTSYGSASNGPFYYAVTAPQFAISSVQSAFSQVIDNLTAPATAALNLAIQNWIINYQYNSDAVRDEVEKFLIINGTKSMIVKNGDVEGLSKSGYATLNSLLYGATSISRMPVFYSIAQKTSITAPAIWAATKDIITV